MRPGQQNKRGRGRSGSNNSGGGGGGGGSNRKGQNPLSRSYDSSGPDVKIRGTAQHVAEKYMNLARDAQSSGDRVMAENYLQHAEHYNRIILTAQAQMQERFQRDDNGQQGRDSQDQDDDDRDSDDDNDGTMQDQRNDRGNDRTNDRDEQQARSDRQPRQDRDEQQARSDRQPRQDRDEQQARPDRQPRQDRQDRVERSERQEPRPSSRPAPQMKPVYDADAPQPVIEGVPAEVAIGQETPEADGAPRTAPRRRGRPKRVRVEDGADAAGTAGDSMAAVEPEAAE